MLRFGRNVDLLVLDERQYRDAQPCGDPLVGNLDPSSPQYCSNLNDPRTMLGAREGGFLDTRLAASNARWKVIANEVPITPIQLVQAFVGPDDWAGYTQARTALLQTIQKRPEHDVVFVTGDIHTFVTSSVPVSLNDPTPVAPEFVGGSFTSFGFGEITIDVGRRHHPERQPGQPGHPPEPPGRAAAPQPVGRRHRHGAPRLRGGEVRAQPVNSRVPAHGDDSEKGAGDRPLPTWCRAESASRRRSDASPADAASGHS